MSTKLLMHANGATFTVTASPSAAGNAAMTITLSSTDQQFATIASPSTVAITTYAPPAITLSASTTSVCSGQAATLTATVTSGGPATTYTWLRNGISMGTSTTNTYALPPMTATATYSVSAVNTNACTGTSNSLPITVHTAPTVSLISSSSTLCTGGSATLTATVTSGSTTSMTYTWQRNGAGIGTSTVNTYTVNTTGTYTVLVNNGSGGCLGTSNTVMIAVGSAITPSITVFASDNPVCDGTSVTFSINTTNPGTSPSYRWLKGGIPIGGATGTGYTYVPVHGDVITCEMTSSELCASPNPVSSSVTMTVTAIVNPSVGIIATPD